MQVYFACLINVFERQNKLTAKGSSKENFVHQGGRWFELDIKTTYQTLIDSNVFYEMFLNSCCLIVMMSVRN